MPACDLKVNFEDWTFLKLYLGLIFVLSKDYAEMVAKKSDEYNAEKDTDLLVDNGGVSDEAMFPLFKAGQSRRIWGELYKVI